MGSLEVELFLDMGILTMRSCSLPSLRLAFPETRVVISAVKLRMQSTSVL
jgi:hypothetical protein